MELAWLEVSLDEDGLVDAVVFKLPLVFSFVVLALLLVSVLLLRLGLDVLL